MYHRGSPGVRRLCADRRPRFQVGFAVRLGRPRASTEDAAVKNLVLFALWFLSLILFTTTGTAAEKKELKTEPPMTNARLEEILRRLEPALKGGNGRWQMMREGIPVMVMTDESHNRMRIIAPAGEVKQVDPEVLMKMMEANFVAALDARYTVFNGIVWAAFIHPLDSLIERDLVSGLKQVTTLVKTTGTSYSSSELHFGPQEQK
jgi:hypothetical protein